ncbi:hypothetical protein C6P50_07625 [Enterococcus mundtii]|nr:hypothetical protein C6P50_07625 [Enterococcus mundtii]
MFLWLKTLYRKRTVTWPFIFYTIIWTLSLKGGTTLNLYLILLDFPLLVDFYPMISTSLCNERESMFVFLLSINSK